LFIFGGASYLWLGGNDLGVEGNWVWIGDNDDTFVKFWQGTVSGIDEPANPDKSFIIYPNPTSGKIRISINDIQITVNNNTLNIYNTVGKLIKKRSCYKY